MEQMLQSTLIEIFNMSLTASVMIIAVFLARVFLKKAPAICTYALWGIVLFRLLCPLSFESDVSLLGLLQNEPAVEGRMEYIPQDIGYQMEPEIHLPVEAADEMVNSSLPAGNPQGSVNSLQIWLYLAVRIWILGIAVMVIYSVISLLKLQKQLKNAVWERDNVYRMQGNHSPFVYGIFGPCIYLPEHLEASETEYVLLHEQIHIKRGDHIYRLLAYLALCIHWFNPLVWLAFSYSGRDMEISCDEAVIRKLGGNVKKEYSASLLNLACGDKVMKGIPVAFGESDTGSRIKHVLKYKKPARTFGMATAAVCVVLAIVLLANPANDGVSVYGVIGYSDEESEGIPQRIVTIPRSGAVLIPGCDEIIPYGETENTDLEIGDLVKITFEKKEVWIEETYPGRYTERAKTIEVLGKDFSMESMEGGLYLIAIPSDLSKMAKAGDQLELYRGEKLLNSANIVQIDAENRLIFVEMEISGVETFFENFESGIEYQLIVQNGTEAVDETEQSEEKTLNPESPEDGSYYISVRSIAQSARCIDRYVADEMSETQQELYFAENCEYLVNWKWTSEKYEAVDFDDFANLVNDKKDFTNAPCIITFENGLIMEAKLKNGYFSYGISYQPYTQEGWSWNSVDEILDEVKGEERSGSTPIYSTLREELKFDVSDIEGEELVEVYTGDVGDGNCGIVEFKSSDGERIHSEFAHISRVGWNNIYLGEAEGVKYILKVCIEDRDTNGVYNYQVFRLGGISQESKQSVVGRRIKPGKILQIAGSKFEWGDHYTYDDELFKEWADGLEYYLEHSFLILSSQNGEIRTEQICEADKYNYETLKRE